MVKVSELAHQARSGAVDSKLLLASAKNYFSEAEYQQLTAALALAEAKLSLQQLALGIAAYPQALVLADILLKLNLDVQTVIAGVLYFAFAADLLSAAELEQFDPNISALLKEVKKIAAIHDFYDQKRQSSFATTDNLRKLLLAVVEDVRVVFIKLAERLCLLRQAMNFAEADAKAIASEVKQIYAPLANRLGIGQIKWEMEDLSFRFLQPEFYKKIAKLLAEKRSDREIYIQQVIKQLEQALPEHDINEFEVQGRVKHIYSIYRKMQLKDLDFTEIFDVRAVRILTAKIADCYAVLGLVHSFWQHIPKEFDDYIATPKENGYRSLHTAVIGPEGKVLEIQIRTFAMHEEAELGFASHWRYKEGGKNDPRYEAKIAALRQLMAYQAELDAARADEDDIKTEFFSDRVYVFTPSGDVVDLRTNSTTLDFAYHIHSEIGNHCRGAKVNGLMVPLSYQLKSGDQIEILTNKSVKPSRDWLNPHSGYVNTPRARAKIAQWFKLQDRDANINAGEELLDRELKRLGQKTIPYTELLAHFKINLKADLLAQIGAGDLRINQVIEALKKLSSSASEPELKAPTVTTTKLPKTTKHSDIIIAGVDDLLYYIAKCCQPVPGDSITGYITQGRGIAIHRSDCQQLAQLKTDFGDRLVSAYWQENLQNFYPVNIHVFAVADPDLIARISSLLAAEKLPLLQLSTKNFTDRTMKLQLRISLPDLAALSKIIAKLMQLQSVHEVTRCE